VSDAHRVPRLFEVADLITPMVFRVAATARCPEMQAVTRYTAKT